MTTRRGMWTFLVPAAAAMVALGLLVSHVVTLRAQVVELSGQRRSDHLRGQVLTAEREAIFAALAAEFDKKDALIRGHDAATGRTMDLGRHDVDVVYMLAERCQACLKNLPLLDSLHRAGVRVVGVSTQDRPVTLAKYAERHNIAFPLIAKPGGALPAMFSVPPTPLTLVLTRGALGNVRVGSVSAKDLSGNDSEK